MLNPQEHKGYIYGITCQFIINLENNTKTEEINPCLSTFLGDLNNGTTTTTTDQTPNPNEMWSETFFNQTILKC